MKKYWPLILGGLVLLLALRWGWEHRPWQQVVFQGYVEGEYIHIAAPIGGRLKKLQVHRGESVQAGQSLFQLEPAPEQQQTGEAAARAQLASQNRERAHSLFNTKAISKQDLDQAESELKAAVEFLAQIEWKLRQKSQSAQEAGYVQDTYYVAGEWVEAGRPVVSLLPPANVKVRFFVSAVQRAQLQVGRALSVKIFGTNELVDLTLSYLSSEAEYTPPVIYSNDTRAKLTFLAEATPTNSSPLRLTPGQPVEVRLK